MLSGRSDYLQVRGTLNQLHDCCYDPFTRPLRRVSLVVLGLYKRYEPLPDQPPGTAPSIHMILTLGPKVHRYLGPQGNGSWNQHVG